MIYHISTGLAYIALCGKTTDPKTESLTSIRGLVTCKECLAKYEKDAPAAVIQRSLRNNVLRKAPCSSEK